MREKLAQIKSKRWAREVSLPPSSMITMCEALGRVGIGIFEPMAIPRVGSFEWVLIDTSSQPYRKDPFTLVLKTLRDEKKVEKYRRDPSRFGLSPDEIGKAFFPEFVKFVTIRDRQLGDALRKKKNGLRTPTESEFRLLVAQHPNVLLRGRGEWLDNEYGRGRKLTAVRGEDGGLKVEPENGGFFRSKSLGFRVVVDFQKKPYSREEIAAWQHP